MKPPDVLKVLDKNGGFTAVTTKQGGTLWRPGAMLKFRLVGEIQSYDEKSFYQRNEHCTRAIYKVKGYRYPVVVWFDNVTGERVA